MSSSSNYELIITDPAREDLSTIAVYTFTKWGEEQTAKYTEELYKTISSITTQILENPAVVCQKLSKAENQGGMSYFIVLSINQFLLYVFCTKAWIANNIHYVKS